METFSLTAKYLGAMTVTGGVIGAHVSLTEADSKGFGLRSLTGRGTVADSAFDVRAGNVGAVTVGRFTNSNLFVGYNSFVDFGNMTTADPITGRFALLSFRTTAEILGDPANPLNWTFSGSRIVADTIGTVKLTGVKSENGVDRTNAFGVKYKTAAKSILVLDADVPAGDMARKANLVPAANGAKTVNEFNLFDVA